ncbi:type II secretion system protein GspE [Anoxybacterium hadale]|uniref:Type II secretion system protein GspE n=2 Tax=Anoxybacterium hadale TaxID=3408580 RepID=A0ACD1AGX9_9FIRM|nr:type II secretion system protein GspE [Clostridiales bacterium]
MEKPRHTGNKRLGDLLVENGTLKKEQLTEVLIKQKNSNKRLGELLIEEMMVTEEQILETLEQQFGLDRVHLDRINIDKQAVLSVPESLASKYTLIPIGVEGEKIRVAIADPLNIFALDDVKIASGYEVEVVIASRHEILKYIDRFYSSQFAQKAAEELSKEHRQEEERHARTDESIDIKDAPAVKLVDSIIKEAVKSNASDIHIEPFEDYIKIRNRIDGELRETMRSGKGALGALITRIKIMADLNIAEKRLPQDGRIITRVDNLDIDLRVSVLPTVYGEKIVIRILKRDSFLVSKHDMGLQEHELILLNRMIKHPHGIILVTGPTGSGKSTTLYSILNDLNTPNKNIITVEDPVEYVLEGINQVHVNTKIGMTFATGLRSILRQDPDIIMIGEIRDMETAEIAIRSAITGHLILSTMHTNDAPSTAVRLADMGIEPYLAATSLVGVISQRLVRRICPECRAAYEATSREKIILNHSMDSPLTLYRGKGCPRCGNTGYSGRVGVYEIMEISKEHREMIMEGKSSDELRNLSIEKGMRTLRTSCDELVLNGTTTVDELAKITYLKD